MEDSQLAAILISCAIFFNDFINFKLNSDRENPQKVMKYNLKKLGRVLVRAQFQSL
jgi:hypothetical protein